MSMSVTRAIRDLRRKAAEARQAEYDKLSTQEKLAKLPPEPHAKRQRTKLLARLAEEGQKVSLKKAK